VFPGSRLWDDGEGELADRALAALPGWLDEDEWEERWDAILGGIAERLYGSWHERRLARMVEEVRGQLPLASHPAASAMLAAGCSCFGAGRGVGLRIAARLLADVLPAPARQTGRRAA
jgi:hypothetical protein